MIIIAQRWFVNDQQQLEGNFTKCNSNQLKPHELPKCHECDDENKELYIILCGIIMPLLLNIIPMIIILVLNFILLVNLANYKEKANLLNRQNDKTIRQLKAARQKSHHFTIIIMGIWFILTSAPYYAVNTFIRVSKLGIAEFVIANDDDVYLFQAISAVFFNSNHCINIVIYLFFHKAFRLRTFRIVFKLFKYEPAENLEEYYYKSAMDSTYGGYRKHSHRRASSIQGQSNGHRKSSRKNSNIDQLNKEFRGMNRFFEEKDSVLINLMSSSKIYKNSLTSNL